MADFALPIHQCSAGCRIAVRVHPRARRDRLVCLHAGALKIEVAAAPEGGAANRAVERLVAEVLGIATSRVAIVSGATSRNKTVEITGGSVELVAQRIAEALG